MEGDGYGKRRTKHPRSAPPVVSFVTVVNDVTKSVQIRSFPTALWQRVRVGAAETGVGLSQFVIESVRRRLRELKQNNQKGRDTNEA